MFIKKYIVARLLIFSNYYTYGILGHSSSPHGTWSAPLRLSGSYFLYVGTCMAMRSLHHLCAVRYSRVTGSSVVRRPPNPRVVRRNLFIQILIDCSENHYCPCRVHQSTRRSPPVGSARFTSNNSSATRGLPVDNEWTPSDKVVRVGCWLGLKGY